MLWIHQLVTARASLFVLNLIMGLLSDRPLGVESRPVKLCITSLLSSYIYLLHNSCINE